MARGGGGVFVEAAGEGGEGLEDVGFVVPGVEAVG